MKIDGMTAGAIAFAGFAAWYVLRPAGKATTGSAAADQVYSLMTTQRHQVGGALGSNLDALGGGMGLMPGSLRTAGTSYGLQAPNAGFWAV